VLVDHSGEATKAGLRMPNNKLLVVGSRKAGTSLMGPRHRPKCRAYKVTGGGSLLNC